MRNLRVKNLNFRQRDIERSRLYSASKPASWHAARKQKWRLENPEKVKAQAERQKGHQQNWRRKKQKHRDDLILWAMIQYLKFNPPPVSVVIIDLQKVKFWVPVKLKTTCDWFGSVRYRSRNKRAICCTQKCTTAKWRRINRARFKSDTAFHKWQRDRKARYRRTHPVQYALELERNRNWRAKTKTGHERHP
jgi:hypothetical protein